MTGNEMTTIKQERKGQFYKNVLELTLAGGAAFWATNFAISRTPIAAEYRAALSISYLSMIVQSLIGGLIIGFCVSYFLLRFFDKIPSRNPILKSVILSLIALIFATIVLEAPSSSLATSDVLRYFLIGAMFNVLRILALGIVVGYLYDKLDGHPLRRQYEVRTAR
jgi:NhaP-type Na+/H+ or K+/H+ antiporter